jgi:hypothetical protein
VTEILSRTIKIKMLPVVEAGHAHAMKFLSLSVNYQFLSLGEKSGDENFVHFF